MARSTKAEEETTTEEAPEESVKVRKERRGRHIKYMGFSDRRVLNPGERLLGGVDDPLEEYLEWHPGNGHTLNTADYKVPKQFWDTLCQLDDFQDVTDEVNDEKKEVPKNGWEKTWSKEALVSRKLWTPPPPQIEQ